MTIYAAKVTSLLWDLVNSLPICHHLPQRSHIFGIDLPLCCRCTGIYSFVIAGFIVNHIFGLCDVRRNGRLAFFVILSLVTGIEACAEIVLGVDPGNAVRLLTGAVSGFAIGALLSAGIAGIKTAPGKKTS
jgi:uncharacterized membrane protein